MGIVGLVPDVTESIEKESSATVIEEAIDNSLVWEVLTQSSTAQTFIPLLSGLESSMNAFEHEVELGLEDHPK